MTNLESPARLRAAVEEPADAELLTRWCAGDAAALEWLVRRHGSMVLGVCRRILAHADDAEDAFQATFLVLVRKGHQLARREQVAGWLHAVAVRVAQKARSQRTRRREREAQIVDGVDPVAPETAPAVDLRDLLRRIDEELDRLPDKYRLPIVLCELEGRTLEQAARVLGWPRGTVAGRLSRGRELLRRRLARRGDGLPLFLFVPLFDADALMPSEGLVSATTSAASGQVPGAAPAALASDVITDTQRRLLGRVTVLLLIAALLGALGWQAHAASRRPVPDAPSCTTPPGPATAPPTSAPDGGSSGGSCH
jgi:RNA polymerase sigma-70 factor (ECF subfamily)